MNGAVLEWMGWLCYALAIWAFVVYGVQMMRQTFRRPWNGAGLFFTGLALTQVPSFLRDGAAGDGFINAVLCVISLMLAVTLQAVLALRTRKRGDDRRSDDRRAPEAAAA